MEARELRIGNVVNALHHNNDSPNPAKFNLPVIVESVAKDRISTSLGERIEVEYLSGIPLTEEWLLKMGFVQDCDGDYTLGTILYYGASRRLNAGPKALWIACYENYHYDIYTNIQYVHQVQNIYHALTGEELTINDKL